MFSVEERKQRRFEATGEEISEGKYNLIIGAVLAYGFIVNIITVSVIGDSVYQIDPFKLIIAYAVSCIVGIIMVNKSDNPAISFLGYNFIVVPVGVVLTVILSAYVGQSDLVFMAMFVTGGVTLLMTALGTVWPGVFMSMGRTLGISLLITILIEIVMGLVLKINVYAVTDYVVVIIFCGYLGYDWAKANSYPKTVDNAIDSACDLYLDIINLFIRILRILARSRD